MSFRKIKSSNLESTNTVFDDPIVIINNSAGADTNDVGFLAKTTASTYTGLVRDSGTKDYYLIEHYALPITNNDVVPASMVLSDIHLATLNAESINANGISMSGHILPVSDLAYDLGSPTKQWRDIYVGPGSLYVNGQKVLEDNAGTITVSADLDQSLTVKTSGSGVLTLQSATTINVASTLQLGVGVSITSADGSAVKLGDKLDANNNQVINVGTPTLATDAANKGYVDQQVNNILGGAPAVLDTLNEIANAINDDPNFYTTLTNGLATKADISYVDAQVAGVSIAAIGDINDVTVTTPLSNHTLKWNGAGWVNGFVDYAEITNKPTIPTVPTTVSSFTNDAGYLTGFTEADPTVPAHVKAITTTNVNNWNTAYSWGNHATAGYFTGVFTSPTAGQVIKYTGTAWINGSVSYTELTNKPTLFDGAYSSLTGTPTFATVATSGSYTDLTNTPTIPTAVSAFTNDAGYLTSETSHADVVVDGDFISEGLMKRGATAGTYSVVTDNTANWNTAFGWGNHATAGYLTSYTETDTLDSVTARGATTTNAINVGNITTTGYIRGPATLTIDPAGHGDNTGLVVIDGDLTVNGTTTTINSTSLTVSDKNIVLADGAVDGVAANGAGITISGANATMLYTQATDSIDFNKQVRANTNLNVYDGTFTTGSTPEINLGDSYTKWAVPYGSKVEFGSFHGFQWEYGSSRTVGMAMNNAGIVTKPQIPVAHVKLTATTGFSNGDMFVCPTIGVNKGNHYNSTTGLFTAPVSGVYQISGSFLIRATGTTGNYASMQPVLNGVSLAATHGSIYNGGAANFSYENNFSGTQYVEMNAGDTIGYKLFSDGLVYFYATESFISFRLVG